MSERTPAGLLADALAADPSRPLITFYDAAHGDAGRVELSVATFDNWVAKTANFLVDGLAAQPGERVALLLPPHWQTAAWLLACWSAGLVGSGVLLRKWRTGDDFDAPMFAAFGWVTVGVTVVIIALALSPVGFYPYEKDYHYWKPVSGEVASVSKRIISSDGGISERYVVRFVGSNQPYGVDDTRASLVKKGDHLELSCIREWQYAADSGWACRWGGAS